MMPLATQAVLESGHVYRTRDLLQWSANPGRLANRLIRQGKLRKAAHGVYYCPIPSRFGPAPATDKNFLCAFLGQTPFIITGPPRWNALGLGSTSLFAVTLVYNTLRTGEFEFDGRRFLLRRVLFPIEAPPEWFIVDLLQNHEMAGCSLADLKQGLVASLAKMRWNETTLRNMARTYGTKSTQSLIELSIQEARALS